MQQLFWTIAVEAVAVLGKRGGKGTVIYFSGKSGNSSGPLMPSKSKKRKDLVLPSFALV